ncbi:MAG: rhomboid family intramembrane serine protease [Actinomycetota bacterium]
MTSVPPETCPRHPDRITGRHCTRCGRPACSTCLRQAAVGAHCVDCVRAEAGSPATRVATRVRRTDLVATKSIIAITVGAFVLTSVLDGRVDGRGRISADLVLYGPLVHAGEWWRLLTSSLVHFGVMHLFFNMLLLWIIGGLLEPATGPLRFTTIYIVSVLAGSAGALIASPLIPAGGASGGVFGVAAAATIVMQRAGVRFWDTGFGPLIVINLVLDFFIPGVSIAAHIGGLVGGGLATLALMRGRRMGQPAIGEAGAVLVGVIAIVIALIAAAP